ncbi:hypothetical protein FACHB389_30435 [Nostoc calcicola FACHB-389]|nr:PRC-barrel domain-containing protein [Nostoc calcicola FACHB-3891]OKH23584.1 hypothetical protein FACHB389_30435 [Nostoc calcicola FACHB-389]
MRRGTDLIGKIVVAYNTGERIERIQDLIFDQQSDRLLGLLVDDGGLFRSARVIPFAQVQAIGLNAVIVPSKAAVVKIKKAPEIRAIVKRNNVLKGTRILTVNGRDLGTMIDLYFDEQTGVVEGYEVSGGLFADAYSGRCFVPATNTLKIGENFAFVPVETAELMQEQVGGFKGAIQTASNTIQDTTAAANQKLQKVGEIATEKFQETTEAVSRQLQDANQAATTSLTNAIIDSTAQKAFVVGQIADRDVFAPYGSVLAMRGQTITRSIANEAEHLGVLHQLYRAAGGDVAAELNRKIQQTVDTTSNQFQETVKQTTAIADEKLRLTARNTATKLMNAIINPEEQKALVIDRVVDYDVISPNGTLLIAQGQPITLEIAERAEHQGILNQLFQATKGSLTAELSNSTSNIVASYLVEEALGRRVHQLVRTNDGLVVAAPGQIVTQQVIERSRSYKQERALLNAVGLTFIDAVGSSTNRTLSDTGELVVDSVVRVQENVTSLVAILQKRFEQVSQQAIQTLEEHRIKDALGRTVNRIILNKDDSVILIPGDIITHRAIELAREADVLDILLSSVYRKEEQPAIALLNPSEKTKVKERELTVSSS